MSPLDLLHHGLDTAYDRKACHDPTLKGALRGVEEPLVSWRPATDRHTIWELAVHCDYWKYIVRHRLTGEARGSFPLEGSNWFRRPDGPAVWTEERRLLDAEHAALRGAVTALDPADLERTP